jgi:hypothetical protein
MKHRDSFTFAFMLVRIFKFHSSMFAVMEIMHITISYYSVSKYSIIEVK